MNKNTKAQVEQDPAPSYQEILNLREKTEFEIIAKPWRTQLNSRYMPKDHEENYLPSATIPDQSLSIKQILERHSRGIPTTAPYHPVYNGDLVIPDINRLDLSEIHELKLANRARIKEHFDKIEESKKPIPNESSDNKPV